MHAAIAEARFATATTVARIGHEQREARSMAVRLWFGRPMR